MHYASSTGQSGPLKALCDSVISDVSDYAGTSPVQQGPWTSPGSWKNQVLVNKFKSMLADSASAKEGWLSPIQKVMAEDYGMHATIKKLIQLAQRLTLAQNKPGALLAPSSDPKNPRPRLTHMLPAVANYIQRNFSAIDARLQRAVDGSSLEELTSHSPVKEVLKSENAALQRDLADERARFSEARAQVSLLEGKIATIHRTHVGARAVMCAEGGGGGGIKGPDFLKLLFVVISYY